MKYSLKPTPGKWWFSRNDHHQFDIGEGDVVIMRTMPWPLMAPAPITNYQPEHAQANARLVSCALELFAELKALHELSRRNHAAWCNCEKFCQREHRIDTLLARAVLGGTL